MLAFRKMAFLSKTAGNESAGGSAFFSLPLLSSQGKLTYRHVVGGAFHGRWRRKREERARCNFFLRELSVEKVARVK